MGLNAPNHCTVCPVGLEATRSLSVGVLAPERGDRPTRISLRDRGCIAVEVIFPPEETTA